jgi:hypothetical protein
MVKTDPILQRIQAFDRERGGGVAVQCVNRGYSLFSAATQAPIARLRVTGQGDVVEVLWWCRGRWATIGDFGGVVLPLDQALDYIANQPLFWSQT